MKRHHLFVFYCTLLVPIGALAGAGIGGALESTVFFLICGVLAGLVSSFLLVRSGRSSSAS